MLYRRYLRDLHPVKFASVFVNLNAGERLKFDGFACVAQILG